MTPPHPLRCETCGHHKLVGRIPDIDECDILDHTPTESDKKLIQQIGCASHSSAAGSTEEELDELEVKYIHQMHVEIKTGYPQKGDILDWVISELRKTRNTLRQQQRERDR